MCDYQCAFSAPFTPEKVLTALYERSLKVAEAPISQAEATLIHA